MAIKRCLPKVPRLSRSDMNPVMIQKIVKTAMKLGPARICNNGNHLCKSHTFTPT